MHRSDTSICEQGVCQGFDVTWVTTEVLEEGFDEFLVPSGWVLTSETLTTWMLSRDWAAPDLVLTDTDHGLSWTTGGSNALSRSWSVKNLYDEVGSPPSLWLSSAKTHDYSEDDGSLVTWTVAITRDVYGNPTEVFHDSSDVRLDVRTETTWSGSADGSLFVPTRIETHGWDHHLGTEVLTESADLLYDGASWGTAPTAGLLTEQRVCTGPVGSLCSESLVWTFDRTERGAIAHTAAPGGATRTVHAWGFGQTVPVDETNALVHATTRTHDSAGRVDHTIDANGVHLRTAYDGLGRLTHTWRQGNGGPDKLTTEVLYHDAQVPQSVETRTWTHDDLGVGTLRTAHQVLDGFGQVVQTWEPSDTPGHFIVHETLRDGQGHLRTVTTPHTVTTGFVADLEQTQGLGTDAWTAVDAFGTPRLSWTVSTGLTELTELGLYSTLTVDAEGFESAQEFDSHGRLYTLEQGRDGLRDLTATYRYDARGRVQQLTDAAGDHLWLFHDGAGRQREVHRTSAAGTVDPWVKVSWGGPNPTALEEFDGTGFVETVRWTYDVLGRSTTKEVLDRSTGLFDLYTWSWDDSCGTGDGWVGTPCEVSDPAGKVSTSYAPDPVFGGLGWPASQTRDFDTGVTMTWSTDHDFLGRVSQVTWPSGAIVDSQYHDNGWKKTDTLTYGAGLTAVASYARDAYGLPSGWTLDTGVLAPLRHSVTRSNSQQEAERLWDNAVTAAPLHDIDYGFHDNGWLSSKVIDGMEPLLYDYDDLGRVNSLFQGGAALETYTYDAAGSPTHMFRETFGDYTYDLAPAFGQVPHRTRDVTLPPPATTAPEHEAFTYDPFGRLTQWTTDNPLNGILSRSFVYDGSGRLVSLGRLVNGDLDTVDYVYDVDDQLVRETHTGPSGGVRWVHRHNGRQEDTGIPGGRAIEAVLPMLRLEDGADLRISLLEPDGHALWTLDLAGPEDTSEILGVYGLAVPRFGPSVAGSTRRDVDAARAAALPGTGTGRLHHPGCLRAPVRCRAAHGLRRPQRLLLRSPPRSGVHRFGHLQPGHQHPGRELRCGHPRWNRTHTRCHRARRTRKSLRRRIPQRRSHRRHRLGYTPNSEPGRRCRRQRNRRLKGSNHPEGCETRGDERGGDPHQSAANWAAVGHDPWT